MKAEKNYISHRTARKPRRGYQHPLTRHVAMPIVPRPKLQRRQTRLRHQPGVAKMRNQITVTILILVIFMAVLAIPLPAAVHVFDQLIPALMLVIGYYFGQRAT